MPSRRRLAVLPIALAVALAAPGAALAQSAGDDQYSDPFGSGNSGGGGNATPAPTAAPSTPSSTSTSSSTSTIRQARSLHSDFEWTGTYAVSGPRIPGGSSPRFRRGSRQQVTRSILKPKAPRLLRGF